MKEAITLFAVRCGIRSIRARREGKVIRAFAYRFLYKALGGK